ncbi:unnamed protein product, partial [Discosporangium mesarthrocarpum]
VFLAVGALTACSVPPKDDPEALAAYEEANDPFEPANRLIFAANSTIDALVLQPVAITYRDLAPQELKTPFENLITNLYMPISFINAMLQGDLERADMAAQRFAGGIATLMLGNTMPNEEPVYEDAGQTLGVWGVESGPYVMLPLLGPSNFRDTTGTVIDWFVDPFGLFGTTKLAIARGTSNAVINRSKNVDAVRDLQRNSLDYYAAVRSLYRQQRDAAISNGASGDTDGPAPTIGLDSDVDAPTIEDTTNVSANTSK